VCNHPRVLLRSLSTVGASIVPPTLYWHPRHAACFGLAVIWCYFSNRLAGGVSAFAVRPPWGRTVRVVGSRVPI
jgi:hypothetical protein